MEQMDEARNQHGSVTPSTAAPYLWMLCGSLAFALMGIQARAAKDLACDWPIVALARASLPLLFGIIIARAAGARLVFLRPRTLWIRSIAGSISLVCTFYALTQIPVADVFTVTNMFPIWVAVLSWPLLGEPPPRSVWLSVACGIAGVWLIQEKPFAGVNWIILLAVAASFSTAVAMLGLHRLRELDIWAIVVHFSAVALCFCLVVVFVHVMAYPGAAQISGLDGRVWWLLLGIGVSATVGQLCLTKAFVAGTPGKVSVVALAQVPFALTLERIIWDRSIDAVTVLGILLVLAPTAWVMISNRSEGQLFD
jgi:drug/metabolite transporter (DMT)-like permease